MFVRAYLQASNTGPGSLGVRGALDGFAADRGLQIAAQYIEHDAENGLERPELFRLLSDCESGDVLLIAKISRLSRLGPRDWKRLRSAIHDKEVRIVARDLPTSWTLATPADYFSRRMFKAVNNVVLDVLAAVARSDVPDLHHRKSDSSDVDASERYRGRPENRPRNQAIAKMLSEGRTWSQIIALTGCSRTLLARIARDIRSTRKYDVS